MTAFNPRFAAPLFPLALSQAHRPGALQAFGRGTHQALACGLPSATGAR